MQAHEFMTKEPVIVSPDTPTRRRLHGFFLLTRLALCRLWMTPGLRSAWSARVTCLGAAMLIAKRGVIGG